MVDNRLRLTPGDFSLAGAVWATLRQIGDGFDTTFNWHHRPAFIAPTVLLS
jgi:hypothetical protein